MKVNSCVIMSLYKNDKLSTFKQALESILTQTFSSFHFHIQCDGDIAKDVEDYIDSIEDERVVVYKRKENKGLAYSLNELLRYVLANPDYEYVFRMDADDISLPERFKKQIAFFDKNKDVDCLGTWAIEIDSNGDEFFRKQMPISHAECYELFKQRDCLIHPTVAFRRRYFENAGLYPEDTYFGEDTMMWANGFFNGCRFANVPEYLFKFRLDENFFERRRGYKHALSIYKLRRRVNKLLKYPKYTDIYAFMYAFAKMMPKNILNMIYKTFR